MAKKTFGIDFGTSTIKVYKNGDGIILLEKMPYQLLGRKRNRLPSVKKHMKCMKRHRQASMCHCR